MGQLLRAVYEKQLDGEVTNLDNAARLSFRSESAMELLVSPNCRGLGSGDSTARPPERDRCNARGRNRQLTRVLVSRGANA